MWRKGLHSTNGKLVEITPILCSDSVLCFRNLKSLFLNQNRLQTIPEAIGTVLHCKV